MLDAANQEIKVGDKVLAMRKGGFSSVGRIQSFTPCGCRVGEPTSYRSNVYRNFMVVKIEDQS